jgi:hypothetical protein
VNPPSPRITAGPKLVRGTHAPRAGAVAPPGQAHAPAANRPNPYHHRRGQSAGSNGSRTTGG